MHLASSRVAVNLMALPMSLAMAFVGIAVVNDGVVVENQSAISAAYSTARRPYAAPAGGVFASPVPRSQVEKNAILRVLVANIRHAPPRSTIRIVARSFSVRPAADALIAAHRRGVWVKVLVDHDATKGSEAVASLRRELGADRDAASYIYRVKGSARGDDTELHQKTWSFSRTGTSSKVLMVGSTNLSYMSMGQFNNMYSFVGRTDVWQEFRKVFREQVRDRPMSTPAISMGLGLDHVWFYPGFTVDNDPMRLYLARLPADGLRIQIAMLAWHGTRGGRIARVLAEKAREGARIRVIATTMGTNSKKILEAAGVTVTSGLARHREVHHKLMLLRWRDRAGNVQRRIVTGSDNFGTAALKRDEVVVAIDPGKGAAWTAYTQHYRMLVEQEAPHLVR